MHRSLDPGTDGVDHGQADRQPRGWLSWCGVIGAVTASYLGFALVADHLTYPGSVTAIWPSSGIAVAAVIVFGYRALPGIVLGIYLNQVGWVWRDPTAAADTGRWAQFVLQSKVGLSYAVGNVLEAALIGHAIRRFNGAGNPLIGTGNVVRFILVAALLGPLVGTTSGAIVTVALWQWVPWSEFWWTLWTWWVSVVGGVLTIAPPLLFLYYERTPPWKALSGRLRESVLLLACSAAVVAVTFYWRYPFEYLLLPLLIWAAFRYGQAATSWLGGALMLTVIVATTHGFGPFAVDDSPLTDTVQSLSLLQCFTAVLVGTAMIVSAVVAERRRIADALRETNVTLEQRVAERTRELSRARQAAEDANRAKGLFLTNMSHELRTPLNAVLGLSRLALRQSDTVAPGARDNLSVVDRNGRHLLGLIDDVLKMARLESGELPLRCGPFDLSRLLRDVGDSVAVQATEKQLTLTLHVDARLPRRLETDSQRLKHVLINLVSNSIKFTERGGVTVRVEDVSEPSTDDERRKVRFGVEDSGVGIPAERVTSVFEPFRQLDPARDAARGSGLGLTIAQQFVESLGGRLQVSSTLGQGSTFHFTIECTALPDDVPASVKELGPERGAPSLEPSTRTLVAAPATASDRRCERLLPMLERRGERWSTALAEAVRQGDTRAALSLVGDGGEASDELDAWVRERARNYQLPAVLELLQKLPSRRSRRSSVSRGGSVVDDTA